MTTSFARLLATLVLSVTPGLAAAQTVGTPGIANAAIGAIEPAEPHQHACDDGDPCRDDIPSEASCMPTPASALAAIACACQRATDTACVGETRPASVLRKTARACALVSPTTGDPGRTIRRTTRHWSGALRLARTPAARRTLGATCAGALAAALDDAVTRALWLLAGG